MAIVDKSNREKEIFEHALDLASADERLAYLKVACGEDAVLLVRVQALLQADEGAESFLSEEPTGQATIVLVTEKPGDRIGRYKLLQQIGEGGCGVVYMAEQEEPVRRQVALKVIKLGMDTKSVIARFEAERQALALMDHPNIAKVLDAGATDTGRPFFVMELVRGIKITDFCDQIHLSTRDRLDLFTQVCLAIQHAHQKGIIHRDIKPSNILVTLRDGVPVPKVIDFGIAKATQQRLTDKTLFTAFQQFIGTPAYMSPEQAEMSELGIDTRSDIYSLGVLLYELLTGETPFDTKALLEAGLDEIRRVLREQEPMRPSTRLSTMLEGELTTTAKHRQTDAPKLIHLLRGDLDWIVMKTLEKDRRRRYETANGLAADVQRHLSNEPVVARPPTNLYRFQKLARRNKLAFAAASAVVAALLIGLGVSTWMFFKERAARERAVAAEQQANRARVSEAAQRRQAEEARAAEAKLRLQAEANEKKAETEAAKSKQVAQFLKDMLAGVGPSVALGRDTTMLREILDKTAERVGRDLTNQPEVEVELRNTLAETYDALGLYLKAAKTAREAVQLGRARLGQEHSVVAYALDCLARAQWRFQDLEQAETMFREALVMRRKLFGNKHPDVAGSLNNLAIVLKEEGKPAEAETAYREALAIHKLLGDDGLNVSTELFNLAYALLAQGRLAEAESTSREALTIRRKLFGNEHPRVAHSLDLTARVLRVRGQPTDAENMHREALATNRKLLGNEHPDVGSSLIMLARALCDQSKFSEAETADREALAIRRKLIGGEHPDLAVALNDLALVLQHQSKLVEAERLARECLAIREKKLPDYWWTFSARSLLGGILLSQKKYIEAEPLLLSGYAGMNQRQDRIPAEFKHWLKETAERLVQLYEATGQSEKTAEWKTKLANFEKVGK